MNINKKANALVIYHANCDDGFGAAWVFHHLAEKEFNIVEYYAAKYGEEPPWDKISDKDIVYILDFSYPSRQLMKLASICEHSVVLDHHKTAQEDLQKCIDSGEAEDLGMKIIFDMERSGAMLTWDELTEKEAPILVEYIQDNDLWRFGFVNTKDYIKGLRSYPRDFDVWDNLNNLSINILIEEGIIIDRYFNQCLSDSLKMGMMKISIAGIEGLMCNMNYIFASEAGHTMANVSGTFGATYYKDINDEYIFSLRSVGDFDVSAIAKKFGGGGHKNAAGFKIKSLLELSLINLKKDNENTVNLV